jgi:hypothetical protein
VSAITDDADNLRPRIQWWMATYGRLHEFSGRLSKRGWNVAVRHRRKAEATVAGAQLELVQ